jgi:citrate lyase subunit beta/citryl-CoA lyase
MPLLRSMLFTPGNNRHMIYKAGTRGADAIILDLEDAVPMADKDAARVTIRDAIPGIAEHGTVIYIRVNALTTGLTFEDLKWVVQPGIAGIILPKTESAKDVAEAGRVITEQETAHGLPPGSVSVVPLLESARGVLNALEVASAPRVIALAFGALDYTRDLGIALSMEGTELLYPRSHIAVVARAAEVSAIDTPWIDVADQEGLICDATLARNLGFHGKLLVHPGQIGPVNDVFSPSDADIAYASRVIAAFREAERAGLGAVSLDGKMIDEANYRYAKDVIARAEVIRAKRTQ